MEYLDICQVCRCSKAVHTHHLIFGTAGRNLADEDRLTLRVCELCHDAIHNGGGDLLSKQIGQALYELKQVAVYGATKEEARACFLKRYGKNRL